MKKSIAELIRTQTIEPEECAEIVRALHASIPELRAPEPEMHFTLRTGAGAPRAFVEATADALTSSPRWQDSADATPDEIRHHLGRSIAFDELAHELDSLHEIVRYNSAWDYWVAASKARAAFRVGRTLGGDEGRRILPYLAQMRALMPKTGRRNKPA